jgi:hypothetical protein
VVPRLLIKSRTGKLEHVCTEPNQPIYAQYSRTDGLASGRLSC